MKIITSSFSAAAPLFKSVYGWLLVCFASAVDFFQPEKYCFIAVLIAITFDLIWGVSAAVKLKKFILSTALRDTVVKIGVYYFILITVYVVERIIHDNSLIGIKLVSIIAVACELWSMSASMLIIKPNMPFLRIFRLQLKGEIESKVGKNLDKILE